MADTKKDKSISRKEDNSTNRKQTPETLQTNNTQPAKNKQYNYLYNSNLVKTNENITILIVDDDNYLSILMRKRLRSEGFQIVLASTCTESLEWLSKNRVDLILLDHKLPDMTGKQMVDLLAERNQIVPFIIVTGQGDDHLAVEMLEGGALDYLIKDTTLLDFLPSVVCRAIEQIKQKGKLLQIESELEGTLKKSQQQQAQISALLEGSGAVLNQRFEDAARSIFNRCKNLIGATAGYITLLNDDGTKKDVVFFDPEEQQCSINPILPMPINSLREQVYNTHTVVCDNDFSNSKRGKFMPEGHCHIKNILFAPLIIDNKVVGLLALANKPKKFTENDTRIAMVFGERISIVLKNNRMLELLAEREQHFHSITKTANDAIVSIDNSGNITFWNQGAETIFGYSADEISGKSVTLLIPQQFQKAHLRGINRIFSTGKSKIIGKTIEAIGLRKNGDNFPLEISITSWNTNKEVFFTAIIHDITDRKQAEEALRESEQRFRRAFIEAPFPIMIHAEDGEVLRINKVWTELTGYMPEEIPTLAAWTKRAYRKRKNIVKGRIDKVFDYDTKANEGEYVISSKDGKTLIWDFSSAPLGTLPDGRRLVISIAMDITQRKQNEAQIEKLAKFPSENPNPVLRIAKSGTILYSNSAGAALLEQWNKHVGQLVPSEWSNLIHDAICSNHSKVIETRCGERILSFVIAPIAESGYTNIYGSDITEQKKADIKLRRTRDELEVRVRERTSELANTVNALQEEVRERIIAEQQLQERSKILEAFFAHTITPLVFLDHNFDFIRVNRAYAMACQRDASEFCGHNHFELYPDEENKKIFETVVRTKTPYQAFAKPFSFPDHPKWGVTYWNWSLVPILSGKGKVELLIFSLEDVTEQKRAEQKILEDQKQLRTLTSELVLSEERERRQIATDLHDSIGQILAFSDRELGSLRKSVPQKLIESVSEIRHYIKQAIEQTRTLTFDLSPPALYDIGFEAALEELIEQFCKEKKIECYFDSHDQCEPLADHVKILLYRSVRELLVNIAKHARAKSVRITSYRLNNNILLTVEDDGKGFDLSKLENKFHETKRFGLFSIRERLRHIGGRFKIQSANGNGTKITLQAPLKDENNRKESSDYEYSNYISR